MKIATILGTRPEIIRLYHTVKRLPNNTIYFTGQNFEKNLSTDIFNDPLLKDAYKKVTYMSTGNAKQFSVQMSRMFTELNYFLTVDKPDKILVLGDTNSALAGTIMGKKFGIPVYHMEAGNRCFDSESPEEINRKLIDSVADVHLCYTQYAKQNLLNEGVPQNRIHVIGNPMAEFTLFFSPPARHLSKKHILVTIHRQENENNIKTILETLMKLPKEWKKIVCLHPRYYELAKEYCTYDDIDIIESVPFSDFVSLEKNASLIITDSGTVCEEAAILSKPCIVVRKTMERPELLDSGHVILADPSDSESLLSLIGTNIYASTEHLNAPKEYNFGQPVSERVYKILLGKGNYVNISS